LHYTREPEGLWRWDFVYKSAIKTVDWRVFKISPVGRTCFGTVKFVVLNMEHGADQFGFVSGVCEYMKVSSGLQEDIA